MTRTNPMTRAGRLLFGFLLLATMVASPAAAGSRVIVRATNGLLSLQTICRLLGCTVNYGLGDPLSQVFLITSPDTVSVSLFLKTLTGTAGIADAELDLLGTVLQ